MNTNKLTLHVSDLVKGSQMITGFSFDLATIHKRLRITLLAQTSQFTSDICSQWPPDGHLQKFTNQAFLHG